MSDIDIVSLPKAADLHLAIQELDLKTNDQLTTARQQLGDKRLGSVSLPNSSKHTKISLSYTRAILHTKPSFKARIT